MSSSPPPVIVNVSDFSPPSSPFIDTTVNISDPWTISAIVLLGLLVSVASCRIYRAFCMKKKVVIENKDINHIVTNDKKKASHKINFKSRKEMLDRRQIN